MMVLLPFQRISVGSVCNHEPHYLNVVLWIARICGCQPLNYRKMVEMVEELHGLPLVMSR
jgi:hypothetical protein